MKTRKTISSQIKGCKTQQEKCKPGSDKWNKCRVTINKLIVEREQIISRGEI